MTRCADAISRLEQVGGRLFGIAVNMIPKRATGGYYYYYYAETPQPNRKDAKDSKDKGAKDKGEANRRGRGDEPADTSEAS